MAAAESTPVLHARVSDACAESSDEPAGAELDEPEMVVTDAQDELDTPLALAGKTVNFGGLSAGQEALTPFPTSGAPSAPTTAADYGHDDASMGLVSMRSSETMLAAPSEVGDAPAAASSPSGGVSWAETSPAKASWMRAVASAKSSSDEDDDSEPRPPRRRRLGSVVAAAKTNRDSKRAFPTLRGCRASMRMSMYDRSSQSSVEEAADEEPRKAANAIKVLALLAKVTAQADAGSGTGGTNRSSTRESQSVLAQTHKELVEQSIVASGKSKPPWYILMPAGRLRRAYMQLVAAASLFMAGLMPYQLAMRPEYSRQLFSPPDDATAVLILLSDVCFVVTIVLNGVTAVSTTFSGLLLDPKQILAQYARTWLAADLLGALPLDAMCGVPALGLNRLLRMRYVIVLQNTVAITSETRQRQRLLSTGLWVCLLVHWCAMMWGAVNRANDAVVDNLSGFSFAPEQCGYWCLVYVVLAMLLGEAWNTQGSAGQHLVATAIMLFGAFLFAVLFGEIVVQIANLNASASAYQEKMRAINESMQAHHIELRLQARVRRFYEFQWLHQRGVKNDYVRELPEALRSDIAVSQYAQTLQKVPIFASVQHQVIVMLSERLRPAVTMQGDIICTQGMVGHEMYFIETGIVTVHQYTKGKGGEGARSNTTAKLGGKSLREQRWGAAATMTSEVDGGRGACLGRSTSPVPGEDGQQMPHGNNRKEEQIGVLSVGDFFGEMALLSAKTIQGVFRRSQRRRCTVRAATVCMLQLLTADDLEAVAQDEPQLLVEMVNVARQREAQIGEDQRLNDLWEGLGVNFAANRFAKRLKGAQAAARQASEKRGAMARLLARGAVNEIMLTAKQQMEAEVAKEEAADAAAWGPAPTAGSANGGGTGGGVGFSIGGDEPAAPPSPAEGSPSRRSCRARRFSSFSSGLGGDSRRSSERRSSGAGSPVNEGADDDAKGGGGKKKKCTFARRRSSSGPTDGGGGGGGGTSNRRNSTRSSDGPNAPDVSPPPSERPPPPPLAGGGGSGAWARAKVGSGRSVLAFAAATGAGGASSRVGMDEFSPQVNTGGGGRSAAGGGRGRDPKTEESLLGRVGEVGGGGAGAGPGLGALRFSSRLRNKANVTASNRMLVGSGSPFMNTPAQRDMMGIDDDDDDSQQGPMEVDPEAMKHFLLGRTQRPLDLQSKYDHLKVQMERLMTSHREALNALQLLQSGQQEMKRCLAAAKASQASK